MSEIEKKQFQKIDYVVQYPENCSPDKQFPLIIYLHGAGGRGRNLTLLQTHPFFLEGQAQNCGMIAVAPQCYANSWFDIFEQLQDFVRYAAGWSQVDPQRVYLMGASMGGYATWQLAMTCPELFAAMVPICGGGMYWNAERLRDINVWAFHGSDDPVVRMEESQKMVDAVNRCGGSARLTIYPGEGHNAWSPTFQNPAVWEWLLMQEKQSKSQVTSTIPQNDVKNFG